ncbi:type II toxin-antitoxin system RelE/ParE family toxin [Lacticaseibacillus porcinae]|uniref:type II toxin-antitoxin system RelE/ParE family toxin n=1 Tax=Lacticaseibacillus porcinae TaxID=1123687 RepID=UPI000F780083|nr:type II toxin-antitoxin system RelE/ParE family toxin [Lacticaseibacillus porcinae]
MYRVILYPEARADLFKIEAYLKQSFGQRTAQQKIKLLLDQLDSLSYFPRLGKRLPRFEAAESENLFTLQTGKNTVLYHLDDAQSVISIYAIIDNRTELIRAQAIFFRERN